VKVVTLTAAEAPDLNNERDRRLNLRSRNSTAAGATEYLKIWSIAGVLDQREQAAPMPLLFALAIRNGDAVARDVQAPDVLDQIRSTTAHFPY
jgi:hypothetical protein